MALEQDLRRLAATETDGSAPLLAPAEKAEARRRYYLDNPINALEPSWNELLSYTDLAVVLDILARHEATIASSLGIDRDKIKDLVNSLRPIVPIRNRVCHARPLESTDLSVVHDTTKRLLPNSLNYRFSELADVDAKLSNDSLYPLTITIPSYWQNDIRSTKNNLPAPDFDDTGFIGRSADRTSLTSLIMGTHPLINVTGEGGVGKTSLVLRCLYDLVDQNIPVDMVYWTSLKTNQLTISGIRTIVNAMRNEIDVLKDLSGYFGGEVANLTKDQLFEEVHEILDNFSILLVIDNLETIDRDALRPLFINIPRKSKILLTSRIGIGEIEVRYDLKPMEKRDAVVLFRRLATLYNVHDLARRPDAVISSNCARLFYNPLAIRWTVQSYANGATLRDITENKKSLDDVLEFCFQNLYSTLTDEQKKRLRILVAMIQPLSAVQVALLSEDFDTEKIEADLRYLFHLNLVRRVSDLSAKIDSNLWTTSEFARSYILSRDKEVAAERIRVQRGFRVLIAARDEAKSRSAGNPFRTMAIQSRSTDEDMLVHTLGEALTAAHDRDQKRATALVQTAKKLLPNFYEVWRVSAQVRTMFEDVLGAQEDFERALDYADGTSEPLLLFFAEFLSKQSDFQRAVELLEGPATREKAAVQVVAAYGRMLARSGEVVAAVAVFGSVEGRVMAMGGDERAYFLTQYADCLRRAAELERKRKLPEEARDYAVASLKTVEQAFLVARADERLATQGRACIREACQILTLRCSVEDWTQLAELIVKLRPFCSFDDDVRWSLESLKTSHPDIAREPTFIELTSRAKPDDAIYGTVKSIPPGQDYAFIAGDDGEDYYLHCSALVDASGWMDLVNRTRNRVKYYTGRARNDGKATPAVSVQVL